MFLEIVIYSPMQVTKGSSLKEIKISITKEIFHTADQKFVADNENPDTIHK